MTRFMLSLSVVYIAGIIVMVSGLEPGHDYKQLVEKISQLEKTQEISIRKQSIQDRRISQLEEKIWNYEKTIEQQRVKIENLEAKGKHDDDNREVDIEHFPVDKRIQRSGERRRRSFPEVPVAFSAVLDHDVGHSGIDQTVIFNKMLLNDGNAYNPHTGVFTVPREGVYLFYFAFGAGYEPHRLWMHIVVDGQGKAAGVADTWQAGHDAQGTNLVMLHLQKGDSVWVTTFRVADKLIYGSQLFTTFSGVLLYE